MGNPDALQQKILNANPYTVDKFVTIWNEGDSLKQLNIFIGKILGYADNQMHKCGFWHSREYSPISVRKLKKLLNHKEFDINKLFRYNEETPYNYSLVLQLLCNTICESNKNTSSADSCKKILFKILKKTNLNQCVPLTYEVLYYFQELSNIYDLDSFKKIFTNFDKTMEKEGGLTAYLTQTKEFRLTTQSYFAIEEKLTIYTLAESLVMRPSISLKLLKANNAVLKIILSYLPKHHAIKLAEELKGFEITDKGKNYYKEEEITEHTELRELFYKKVMTPVHEDINFLTSQKIQNIINSKQLPFTKEEEFISPKSKLRNIDYKESLLFTNEEIQKLHLAFITYDMILKYFPNFLHEQFDIPISYCNKLKYYIKDNFLFLTQIPVKGDFDLKVIKQENVNSDFVKILPVEIRGMISEYLNLYDIPGLDV